MKDRKKKHYEWMELFVFLFFLEFMLRCFPPFWFVRNLIACIKFHILIFLQTFLCVQFRTNVKTTLKTRIHAKNGCSITVAWLVCQFIQHHKRFYFFYLLLLEILFFLLNNVYMHKSRVMRIIMHQERIKLKRVGKCNRRWGVYWEMKKSSHLSFHYNKCIHCMATKSQCRVRVFCISHFIQKTISAFHISCAAAYLTQSRSALVLSIVSFMCILGCCTNCVFLLFPFFTHSRLALSANLFRNGVIFIHIA